MNTPLLHVTLTLDQLSLLPHPRRPIATPCRSKKEMQPATSPRVSPSQMMRVTPSYCLPQPCEHSQLSQKSFSDPRALPYPLIYRWKASWGGMRRWVWMVETWLLTRRFQRWTRRREWRCRGVQTVPIRMGIRFSSRFGECRRVCLRTRRLTCIRQCAAASKSGVGTYVVFRVGRGAGINEDVFCGQTGHSVHQL